MDLVISCMALVKPPTDVTFAEPLKVLHWMPPTTPGKHPSWTPIADQLREPPYRKGRLLPNLCAHYGIDFAKLDRVAAFGFSAGANNGLRELLRNPEDRQRLAALFSVDGLHPNLRPMPLGDGPKARYAAWDIELEPFADFATAAAYGERACVFTASNVAAPSKTNAKTADALRDVAAEVRARTKAAGLPPWAGPLVPSGDFPSSASSPCPIAELGSRGLAFYWYAGTDAAAHIAQGQQVTADLWRDWLVWLWSPETAGRPGSPSSPGPVAVLSPAAHKSSASSKWSAPAVAGVVGSFLFAGGLAGHFIKGKL